MVEVVGLTGVNSSTLNEASFKNEYFSQHFWREKNHGFAVLYQNMKHGQICVKYLQDFIRESATSEDVHGKHLSKLTKHAVNPCTLGSSAPMFEVLRTTTDKLSSCHMDIVFKLHDIIKDLSKYLDEQRIKHKQVKDEVSGTLYSLHCVQSTAATVQKSKDKYHQLCMEVEKMKRIGSLQKDVIKVEGKRIKAADEYKMALDKYSTIRNEYEQKMSESIKRFQEIEVAHLKRMKSFLDKYILSFENTSVLISQVHQEFRELVNDNTIDTLIKQYWDTNGTCTEKPSVLVFEECDAAAKLEAYEPTSNGDATTAGGATPPISKGSKRPIMPFKKRKAPKQPKETSNLEMAKEVEKKPKDPPDEDTITVIIDEDGFTIRPEIRKMSRNSWGSESSDDSDDFLTRRINVKINPKDEQTSGSGSDIETLNSVVRNLTLNSPSPMAAKKQTGHHIHQSKSKIFSLNKPVSVPCESRSRNQTTQSLDLDSSTSSFSSVSAEVANSIFPRRRRSAANSMPSCDRVQEVSPSKSEIPVSNLTPVPAPRKSLCRKNATAFPAIPENDFSTRHNSFTQSTQNRNREDRKSCRRSVVSLDITSEVEKFSNQAYVNESGDFSSDSSESLTGSLTACCEVDASDMSLSHSKSGQKKDSTPPVTLRQMICSPLSDSVNMHRNTSTVIKTPSKQAKVRENSVKGKQKHCASQVTKAEWISFEDRETTQISAIPIDLKLCGSTRVNTKSEKEVLDAFDDDLDKPLSDDYSEGGGSGIAGRMDEVKNGSSSNSPNNIPSSTIATRPNKLSLSNVEVEVQKASSTSSAPLATCEIWSPATPQDKTSTTSRNLTPIIHVQGNPIPVAAAFTETIHAYFKGANTNRCLVKITGELQISFPANMVKSLTSNPHPPVLSFKVKKGESVKDFQPNQNLLVSNLSQSDESTRIFSCDMTSLVSHIKRKAETNPDSLYFNVQVLTYQFISHSGYDMTPLQVTSHWKCDADHTNVCVEYKYNPNYTSKALQNVQVIVPIDGKVTKTDSSPSATWVSSQNRLVWKLATVSENNPSGVLESNLSLASGPSKPTALAVQFSSEGSTLSGVDFELVGLGYRLSLVKKRYVSGKYVAEGL